MAKNNNSIDNLISNIRKANIDNNFNNAIIYLRSSSVGQNKEENNQHSIITQRNLCIDYARKNNLNIIEIIEEVRRANDIKKLKIDKIPDEYANIHLIIADPSRISRDFVQGADFIRRCQESNSNITIHSVRDNSISNTSLGKRKIIDLIMVANDESDTVSKRIKSMNQLKKQCGSKFGIVPFGYTLKKKIYKNNGYNFPINTHIPNKEEQKIIKLIGWLRFGCEINTFYRLFRSIINNPTKKLYYQNKEWSDIQYKECTIDYIVTILNHHNILKKGKKWTISKVSSIIKSIPIKDRIPYKVKSNNSNIDNDNHEDSSEDFDNDNNEDFTEDLDNNEDSSEDFDNDNNEDSNENILNLNSSTSNKSTQIIEFLDYCKSYFKFKK
jgi:DNA invertase Pin-like site-specific DNA recombinase